MHRIFSAIFKQYMCILCNIYRTRISSFVHTGITIATQVSQFKKKVTHDDTFNIFIFLRNRTFQQNKAHGVDFSELLYFYQRNPGKISQTTKYIYIILARKHEKYLTCYILTFAVNMVNVPSNLNKSHIYKNENLNQRFSNSASNFLKSDI